VRKLVRRTEDKFGTIDVLHFNSASMRNATKYRFLRPRAERICSTENFLLCSGGLEPHFTVLFSAIFQGFSWGISIWVETCGK
jgi:hypothetical protein